MVTEESTEEQSLKERLSNMELENNLLRGEVKLLNTELVDVKRRAKEMQECTLLIQYLYIVSYVTIFSHSKTST